MHRPRSRPLGFLILLLAIGTLALAACNSGGGSPKASGTGNTVTGAESPTTGKTPAKGTLADAVSKKL